MEYLLEEYGDVIICITGLAIAFTFLREERINVYARGL